MKAEVNTQALADAVAWTTRVIDARPASPILAGVKLEAIDGTLQLSTFNFEISARDHIEASVVETGSTVVQGKILADITRALPEANTTLTTENSTLIITSGKAKFTMQLMPESEYPDLPAVPGLLGKVDGQTFQQAIDQACVAVSREETRPVLTGVYMQYEGDKVIMTSTDRFRLSRATFTWTPNNPDVSTTTLLRGSFLRDFARTLDTRQNVVIDFNQDNPALIAFENASRVSTSQLIDGEFPAVDRLFADEYPIQAVIRKDKLIQSIKRVSLVAERNAPIRMAFSGNSVTLSAGVADENQATDVIETDFDGSDITVAFNPSYLIEGLSAITEPWVRMKMTTAIKPVEFNGQQEQDSDESMDYRYLLVPMRFTN